MIKDTTKTKLFWPLSIICLFLALFIIYESVWSISKPITISYLDGNKSRGKSLDFAYDPLNHDFVKVGEEEAKQSIKNAHNSVTLPNGDKVDMLAEEIPVSAIIDANGLSEIVDDYCNSSATASCTHSIGGLEIFYAIKSGKLTLYYKPVLFCQTNYAVYGQGGRLYHSYLKGTESPHYYYYDKTLLKFSITPPGENEQSFINLYQNTTNGIRISRTSTHTPGDRFRYTEGIDGDVRSMVFPIDEIKELCKNQSSICFWNATEDIKTYQDIYTKHIILLSTGNVYTFPKNGLIFTPGYTRFANLSHLCPPSCNAAQFIFSVESEAP